MSAIRCDEWQALRILGAVSDEILYVGFHGQLHKIDRHQSLQVALTLCGHSVLKVERVCKRLYWCVISAIEVCRRIC